MREYRAYLGGKLWTSGSMVVIATLRFYIGSTLMGNVFVPRLHDRVIMGSINELLIARTKARCYQKIQ